MRTLKHLIGTTVALAVFAMAGAAMAQDDVSITKHNLTLNTNNVYATTGTDEVCAFCHTPHAASTTARPLWNREDSVASYTMYNSTFSATIDMTVAASPQGVSLACLSCHDGFNAINVLNNAPGSGIGSTITFQGLGVGGVMPAGITAVGRDLTNDHPISMDVPTGTGWLTPPATLSLYNSKVECATCHNPHESVNPTFLRISNAGSALCSSCHDK